MDYISRKTGNVAAFPMKLDLQMFADELDNTPNLEDTDDFKADAKEFEQMNAKIDKFVAERTPKETEKVETKAENEPVKEVEKAVTPEVAAPDDKPKQDSETNKAFQEMRKQLEAEQAKAKKADELIALQYGNSHGIFTVEQYEQRLQQDVEAEQNERYQAAGLTPEEIQKLKDYDRIQQETSQENQTKRQQTIKSQWDEVFSAYPDIEKRDVVFNGNHVGFSGDDSPAWLTPDMLSRLERGQNPLEAYRNAHFDTILQNAVKGTKAVAKQEALNQLNSKDHMKPSGSDGGDVDHVEIDAQTMTMYRKMTGKSDAEIRKFHKKQLAGG